MRISATIALTASVISDTVSVMHPRQMVILDTHTRFSPVMVECAAHDLARRTSPLSSRAGDSWSFMSSMAGPSESWAPIWFHHQLGDCGSSRIHASKASKKPFLTDAESYRAFAGLRYAWAMVCMRERCVLGAHVALPLSA